MYTFKQNMSKEVCVAWWPEATIQRCKLRAATGPRHNLFTYRFTSLDKPIERI